MEASKEILEKQAQSIEHQDEAMSNCDASHSLHRAHCLPDAWRGWEKCLVIFIDRASPGDANEVLALQKLAYQSEAELNGDDNPSSHPNSF